MTMLQKMLTLALILALAGAVGALTAPTSPSAAADEILLEIDPHVRDDVFLMEAQFSSDGILESTQGVCNANMRSPLKGSVYFQLLQEDFPNIAEASKLSISLSVQNEPFSDENTMNTNQVRLLPVQNEITLSTALGQHPVLILRDDADGYYLTVLKGTLLSPDGRYRVQAELENSLREQTMVEITIQDTWGLEADFVFSPVRSLDFWGLYWEDDRLAVDSSDVGTLYYAKDAEGVWKP